MKVIEEPRQATTDVSDAGALVAEALIREAGRHRRRRHLAYVAVAIVVIAVVAVTVVANRRTAHNAAVPSNEPKLAGPPMGRVVSLKRSGPLAVGPNGALYVVDEQRHEVLVRQTNGQFRVVAGDGRDGFSGDGGPATKAALFTSPGKTRTDPALPRSRSASLWPWALESRPSPWLPADSAAVVRWRGATRCQMNTRECQLQRGDGDRSFGGPVVLGRDDGRSPRVGFDLSIFSSARVAILVTL